MTKTWGPLGWATLHSVAAMYSDYPSSLEKALISRWMDAFQRTIVCERCREHFLTLFTDYKRSYPDWNASRTELMLFSFRAHNTVNSRNRKPIHSLEECVRLLKKNITRETASLMRQSYIVYVRKEWARDTTMRGISTIKYIQDMIAVERDYWSEKHFVWDISTHQSVSPIVPVVKEQTSSIPKLFHLPNNLMFPKARFSFLSR